MKFPSEILDPAGRDISHAVTLLVVALHTLIHLVTIFILAIASIGDTPLTLPFHRLTAWTAPEWFLGVSILSLTFVVSAVVMGTLMGKRSYPWLVALFQVALAVGTCVYTMILNHLFPFMALGQ